MQGERSFRDRKLCECGNQICSMGTLDDNFIAGELAIERYPASRKPEEWMEPYGTQRQFVKYADQIVAPSCVGKFVKQDSVEFPLIE